MLTGLFVCYTIVFSTIGGDTLAEASLNAAINIAPLGMWGGMLFEINRRWLLVQAYLVQIPTHIFAAALFASLWYFTVTILLGWRFGDFSGSFSVRPFSAIAFIWQVFQGVVIYSLVTTLALIDILIRSLRSERAHKAATARPQPPSERRVLVRGDDELISINVDEIVCIERAGDYAQIITPDRRHLTRKSLVELERQLPEGRFIRVHRSQLINLEAMESAEPIGGGRLRVRLSGGVQIDSSRSGAKALRERAG
jgi:DNA-binding LytR/AlgR family response regulator